jgi:transcription initiation factor TFIIB
LQTTVESLCPECGGASLIQDVSEVVCGSCGYVVDTVVDQGPERRNFSPEESIGHARTGAPNTLLLHDLGIGSSIISNSRDPDKWLQVNSLRKWQSRVRVAGEKNLAVALSEISRLASRLSLPKNVAETASVLYRRALKKHMIRGRTITSFVAAAIYLGCREAGICRSISEIADAAGEREELVARYYRFIVRSTEAKVPPTSHHAYASLYANKLALSGKTYQVAVKVLKAAEEARLTVGRGPRGTASAAVYVASVLANERITQRNIAEVAGVTEVTIRNRYKEMLERISVEMPL